MGSSGKTILLAINTHHHSRDAHNVDDHETTDNILKVMDIIKDALNKQMTQKRGIAEETEQHQQPKSSQHQEVP